MSSTEWRSVPIGLDAQRWVTRTGCRLVLVVVHTVTSGQRLRDVVQILAGDLRVQVVFTIAPDVFGDGVAEFLGELGGVVIPWQQAITTEFDLALAAGYGGLHELHTPSIVLPHGAGHNKLVPRRQQPGLRAARGVYGLEPQRLVRDGAVVPAAIVLSHRDELSQLVQQCPEALPAAVVAGDPCYDRLVASMPRRRAYRDALGVSDGRKLVVVASTWGSRSLFGEAPSVFAQLPEELPRNEFRVVALIHPNVWYGHGTWQVRAWLADGRRNGLGLVSPRADWCGVLVAADWIIGDHGSVTLYGAAAGVPIVLAHFPDDEVHPDSPAASLAAAAPSLRLGEPARSQLRRASACFEPGHLAHVVADVTSEPGRFGPNMCRLMYRLLKLPPPPMMPTAEPADLPYLIS